MEALAELLRYVNLVALATLAAFALLQRRRGLPGAGWVALAFAALASVFLLRNVAAALDAELSTWGFKLLVAAAVAFPYALFRFTARLAPPSATVRRVAAAATGAVLLATLALPELPLDEEARPAWLWAYFGSALAQWAFLLSLVAVRLWRGGRGEPTVTRRRMRSLSIAALALFLAVALAALGPAERGPQLDLAFRLFMLASIAVFGLAFAPPRPLRALWRRPEQQELQRATQDLVRATVPDGIPDLVLPAMARLVGAKAVALLDEDGRTLAQHSVFAEMPAPLTREREHPSDTDPVRLAFAGGSVLAWRSPFAPFFGEDELELLGALGALTVLALDRARLFAHEQEARHVLEQADELKSAFIAIASHELRGPASAVYGFAELLAARVEGLAPERQRELALLHEQAGRLVGLIEQLLDLSRLEAERTEIHPKRLLVRERLEAIVQATAGERSEEIALEVAPELEALADPDALDRIVSNLVTNAFRYGAAPITISAEQRDRHFRLAVEDCGQGVPAEFVPRLFERFTRSDERSSEAGGSGLGLAIAQAYAEAHHGRLLYAERTPHGARFELVLPAPGPVQGAEDKAA